MEDLAAHRHVPVDHVEAVETENPPPVPAARRWCVAHGTGKQTLCSRRPELPATWSPPPSAAEPDPCGELAPLRPGTLHLVVVVGEHFVRERPGSKGRRVARQLGSGQTSTSATHVLRHLSEGDGWRVVLTSHQRSQ